MKLVKESIVLSAKGKKKLKESVNDIKKDTTYLRFTDNKNCDNKVSGSFSEISKESPRALKKFIKAEKKANGKLSPAAKEVYKKLKKSSKVESLKESKLNEDFTENEIRDAVWQYCSDYSYIFTSEFYDLAKDILGRIDFDELNEDNIYETVYDAMDESLIYTEDQWKMMRLYQSPLEANFEEAWSDFGSDLIGVVDILLKNKPVSDVE